MDVGAVGPSDPYSLLGLPDPSAAPGETKNGVTAPGASAQEAAFADVFVDIQSRDTSMSGSDDRGAGAEQQAGSGFGLGPYAAPQLSASVVAKQAEGDPGLASAIQQVRGIGDEFQALNAAPRAGESTLLAPAPSLDPTTANAAAQAAVQAATMPVALAQAGEKLPDAYDAQKRPPGSAFDVLG